MTKNTNVVNWCVSLLGIQVFQLQRIFNNFIDKFFQLRDCHIRYYNSACYTNTMNLDSAVFYSDDIDRAISFYKDVIGLKVDYIQEGIFASFWFENDVRLGIKKAVEGREIPGTQSIFIAVTSIEKLYEAYKRKQVIFYKKLVEFDWGKQFSILDPDGNKVLFIERI